MKQDFKYEWITGDYRSRISIFMYFYQDQKEMQLDLVKHDRILGPLSITSNITVKDAKVIRDRLNEFIYEIEHYSENDD